MARACGVFVIEFSLGMGPRILSHVSGRSGTRYSWKLLPFGGSCMMKGEDETSLQAEEGGGKLPEEGSQSTEGRITPAEKGTRRDSFSDKKVWQRMLIIAAGPVFNFFLAFLFALFLIGAVGYDPPVALKVSEGFPAKEAGVKPGDTIRRLGSSGIEVYRDISDYVLFHQKLMASGKKLRIDWVHEGEKKSSFILPKQAEDGRYLIGIVGTSNYRTRGNVFQVIRYSAVEVGYWIRTTIGSLGMIFRGQVTADDVSGPVGVVKAIGNTVEETKSDGVFYVWLNLLQISILLTANLGVMNLLPFPALDGGRLLLLVIEAARRKKMDPKIEAAINYAGFMILMGLMVFVMMNDTRKLF